MSTDTTTPTPPRHRHEMKLSLGADTLADLVWELRTLTDDLERDDRDEAREVTSSAGWHYVIAHDPTMTPARFKTDLQAWAAARRTARKASR